MSEIAPPTGAVALVFTDVAGSAELWEAAPDAMREAMQAHDAVLFGALARHRGYGVKTDGDAWMLAFSDAREAVAWAADVQRGLLATAWPPALLAQPDAAARPGLAGLRVGIGVHAGAPDCGFDEVAGRMDYRGPVANRAARVCAAAHGGQILVGDAVRALLPDLDAHDHGEHRLRGLGSPERLWEVAAVPERGLPSPRATPVDRTNLVPIGSSFQGRAAELAALDAALAEGRAACLYGPAGIGKTRLAEVWAATRAAAWEGGAWRCALREASTMAEVCEGIARVLGLPLGPADPAAQISLALAGRGRIALVLDDVGRCHADVAALIEATASRAPRARFLTTGPAPVVGLPAVPVPPLGAADGVQLLLARVREARGAEPDAAEAALAADLVQLLDGIPLAIELASARARFLSFDQIRGRLGDRLRLLTDVGGGRSLRAALAWSWEHLSPAEQAALARISVFASPFTAEAASFVVGQGDLRATLDAIVDHGLLRRSPRGTWSALHSVGAFAQEALGRDRAAAADARARHVRWFRTLAERLVPVTCALATFADAASVLEDLVVASRAATAARESAAAAPLAMAAAFTMACTGTTRPGLGLLEAVLDLELEPASRSVALMAYSQTQMRTGVSGEDSAREAVEQAVIAGSPSVRARALYNLATVLQERGRAGEALPVCDEALAIDAVDPAIRAAALSVRAGLLHQLGRAEAMEAYEEALTAVRAADVPMYEMSALGNLGALCGSRGDTVRARACMLEALDARRVYQDRRGEAFQLVNLGLLELMCGDRATARDHLEGAVRTFRELGHRRAEGIALGDLSALDTSDGRHADAEARGLTSIGILREVGDRRALSLGLSRRARLLLNRGDLDGAGPIVDEAIALAHAAGARAMAGSHLGLRAWLAALRGDAEGARAALAEGEALVAPTLDQVEILRLLVLRMYAERALRDPAAEATRERAIALARATGDQQTLGTLQAPDGGAGP